MSHESSMQRASASIPSLIDSYEADAPTPARWIAGLTREHLLAYPVPGTWSVQELIVHILESDLAATHRFRRIVAEDLPLLIAYDETLCVRRLAYDRADLAEVVALFDLHRRFTARWLRTVDPSDFARAGIHNQRGKVTLAEFVQVYIDHLRHHERFLFEKRRALGLPLA